MGWREMCKFWNGIFWGEISLKSGSFRPNFYFLGEMYTFLGRFRPKYLELHLFLRIKSY